MSKFTVNSWALKMLISKTEGVFFFRWNWPGRPEGWAYGDNVPGDDSGAPRRWRWRRGSAGAPRIPARKTRSCCARCNKRKRCHENTFPRSVKTKHLLYREFLPVLGVKIKRGLCVISLFVKIALCSTISFKRSRWELSIDVAEFGSILKNYENFFPIIFTLKTGKVSTKTSVSFLLFKESGKRIFPKILFVFLLEKPFPW